MNPFKRFSARCAWFRFRLPAFVGGRIKRSEADWLCLHLSVCPDCNLLLWRETLLAVGDVEPTDAFDPARSSPQGPTIASPISILEESVARFGEGIGRAPFAVREILERGLRECLRVPAEAES